MPDREPWKVEEFATREEGLAFIDGMELVCDPDIEWDPPTRGVRLWYVNVYDRALEREEETP